MHEVTPFVLPAYETVLLTIDEQIAVVTLNRPAVMNALNAQLFTDLESVFTLLGGNPAVRVVIVTGAGEKAFAAGADIAELAQTDPGSGAALAQRGQGIFAKIERCGKPVIAAINGFALGGGCELAMACTMRVAAASARLGQPEVKLGLIPGYGGTQRLPRLVGQGAALKLMLTGELIDAAEALRVGLVDEVAAAEALMTRARALAEIMARMSPLAMAGVLEAVYGGAGMPLGEGLALEAEVFGRLSGSADKAEGVQAFLEKRAATFTGR